MTWNLINEIDGKGYTGFSDREAEILFTIKDKYKKAMDFFGDIDDEMGEITRKKYMSISKEYDIRARAMLECFNMMQEHIKLTLNDVVFGVLVKCKDFADCTDENDTLDELEENHLFADRS